MGVALRPVRGILNRINALLKILQWAFLGKNSTYNNKDASQLIANLEKAYSVHSKSQIRGTGTKITFNEHEQFLNYTLLYKTTSGKRTKSSCNLMSSLMYFLPYITF